MSNAQPSSIYIDPPTIPAGLTIATYRQLRQLQRARKVTGIRRISSPAMVRGGAR